MRQLCLCLSLFFLQTFSKAHAQIDVQHYNYRLVLSDASDTLKGVAEIRIKFSAPVKSFRLQLAHTQAATGKGLHVDSVSGSSVLHFAHLKDTIQIDLKREMAANEIQTFLISYAGVPADGLIISKNKWGDRTFFADNWPDRAHQWLPCNDRPGDKATVDFYVNAPAHYRIISNGVLTDETIIDATHKQTHWHEAIPIPTKVMVIGATRFAVKNYKDSSVVPVSAWAYPRDSTNAFYDYALAPAMLTFFSRYIGPFPFEKLANVQSTTIFGGMENAGAIFYGEKTVTGNRESEGVMAHEIAHQWFGNSATEKSFAHLWLSEGFASYLTHLYLQQTHGPDTLAKGLQKDRIEIIQFVHRWPYPVVDSVSPLMDLLNANSYQKGSWVLHMLRQEVGDTVFQNILRTYYNRYKFSNADTWDFEKVAEEVSGHNLKPFFQQWLFKPGIPKIAVHWRWNAGQLLVTVTQQQKQPFNFPLTIGFYGEDKKLERRKIAITKMGETFAIPAIKKPVRLVLDPDTGLLFEGSISETK